MHVHNYSQSEDADTESPLRVSSDFSEKRNAKYNIRNVRLMLFFAIFLFVLSSGFACLSFVVVNRINKSEKIENKTSSDGICHTASCYQASNFIMNYLNQSVDPCENFYEFACGNNVEYREEELDHFTMATSKMLQDIADIVSKPNRDSDSASMKSFKTFYRACTNESIIEFQSDQEFLKQMHKELGEWPMVDLGSQIQSDINLEKTNFEEIMATITVLQYPIIFRFTNDDFNYTRILPKVISTQDYCKMQSFLPNDDKNVARFKKLMESIHDYLYENETLYHDQTLMEKFSLQFDEMLKLGKLVYFVGATKYNCKNRSAVIPNKQHLITIRQLNDEVNKNKNGSSFDFLKFMEYLNAKTKLNEKLTPDTQIIIKSNGMKYLQDLLEKLSTVYNFGDLNFKKAFVNLAYFHILFEVIDPTESYYAARVHNSLPMRYYYAFFEYIKHIRNDPYLKGDEFFQTFELTRERKCADALINAFNVENTIEKTELQKLFLREKFESAKKDLGKDMLKASIETISEVVETQNWIDTQSKSMIKDKLSKMIVHLSYSDSLEMDDELYNSTEIDKNVSLTNSYIVNQLVLRKRSYAYDLALLNIKQTQTERVTNMKYLFDIFVVNGMYIKEFNTMILPAGLMLEPIFDVNLPIYLNYATLGVYISHEIWHMVHEQIIQSTDIRAYFTKTSCINKNYVTYVKQKYNLDIHGFNALDEQTADYFGTTIAYRTLLKMFKQTNVQNEKLLPGLKYTPEQLFFIRHGQGYCKKRALKQQATFELMHGIHEFRAFQATLMPDFNNVFKCTKNTQMYQYENKDCEIFS